MIKDSVLAVIPARYSSVRFPGKPLVDILGKPMIQRVYERVQRAHHISQIIVATDDQRILTAVQRFGGNAEMTSSTIDNGTERVAIIAGKYDYPIVVNVQGDEPLIDPQAIDQAIELLLDNRRVSMGTLVNPITDVSELDNPNLPKVVLDNQKFALYFSRSKIPFCRDIQDSKDWLINPVYFRHIGLYVYRKDFLEKYVQLPPSNLERVEKLEQLRVLEYGYRIKVAVVNYAPRGVDTPEDLQLLLEYFKENPIEQSIVY